jgi:REP element-mobilizing transposase RayT
MRLRHLDYATGGAYFVTVCASQRGDVFGAVVDGKVRLNSVGRSAATALAAIPHHFDASLDMSIVMPDHVHAVIVLGEDTPGLSVVVGTFKAAVTRATGRSGLWQRGFHDHVIRGERDLDRVRGYIEANPHRWEMTRGWR